MCDTLRGAYDKFHGNASEILLALKEFCDSSGKCAQLIAVGKGKLQDWVDGTCSADGVGGGDSGSLSPRAIKIVRPTPRALARFALFLKVAHVGAVCDTCARSVLPPRPPPLLPSCARRAKRRRRGCRASSTPSARTAPAPARWSRRRCRALRSTALPWSPHSSSGSTTSARPAAMRSSALWSTTTPPPFTSPAPATRPG